MNNKKIGDAKDIDIVMSMYNLADLVIFIRKHQEVYGSTIEMNRISW